MTKQRALLKTTFNRALKGDVRAIRLLLDWIDKNNPADEESRTTSTIPLSIEDEELLDRLRNKIEQDIPKSEDDG